MANDTKVAPAAKESSPIAAAQTPDPVAEQSTSQNADRAFEHSRMETARQLALQPKVRIRIPASADPKAPNYETACVNGHIVCVQKGVFVEVPQTIAELFAEGRII